MGSSILPLAGADTRTSTPSADAPDKTRVDAASRLLRGSALTVAAIAQACGYADHSAFTRQFKATVGLTPRAFRLL